MLESAKGPSNGINPQGGRGSVNLGGQETESHRQTGHAPHPRRPGPKSGQLHIMP